MASAVICMSTGRKFNFSKYIFDSLVRNVDSSSKFYTNPRFIQLIIQNQLGDLSTHTITYISPALTQKVFANMRRVGKGFSGVDMPLFEGMLVAEKIEEHTDKEEQIQALDACAALTRRVEHLEHDKVAQDLEMTKLKTRVKKLEKANKIKTLKLRRLRKGRMIDELDKDEGVALKGEKEEEKKAKEVKDVASNAQVEGRQAEIQAEIYQIDMNHPSKFLKVVAAASAPISAASTIILAAEPNIPAATITAAPVKVAAASTKRRRWVVIRDPKEESSAKTSDETKSKDKGKGIMVEEPKPMKKKQQVEMDEVYARKLHEELNQDIDWNVTIEHVKQKAKEDPFVQRYQKAAKRRRLNQEDKDVEEIKQHLKIVPDEDDDVYTEATPLSRNVPTVDYQIIHLNNKPRYKIIRADGTHQLYVSFITLLKKFDREDLESLWSLVQERFSISKLNNFSDDYLLTTLRAMFGRPDGQDNVWKSQRSVHGQAMVKSWKLLESCGVHIISFTTTQLILLVERRYPILRFTLDQMLNTVRLQVEKHSEMYLKLISLKKNTKCFNAAGEELSAVKHKLMLLDTAADRRVNTAKVKDSLSKGPHTFVGGSWSDSNEDVEEKTKDEKCLMAKASNE
nr:hypothetical protein [Tanacetum cinerariifolium]